MNIPESVLEPFGYTGMPTLISIHDFADEIADKMTAQYNRLMALVAKEELETEPTRARFMAIMWYRIKNTAEVNGAFDVKLVKPPGWGRNAIHASYRVRGYSARISHIMTDEKC